MDHHSSFYVHDLVEVHMIDGKTLPRWTQIYTHIHEDGKNVHILTSALRDWCLKNCGTPEYLPVDQQAAKNFLSNNVIHEPRLQTLLEEHRQSRRPVEPIILCKLPTHTSDLPDVLLVDGHHRFVLFAILYKPVIPCWILEERDWRPFEVDMGYDLTHDQLRRVPVAASTRRHKGYNPWK